MEEQWKDIFGYEELYQVSNYGRVRSLPRNGTVNEIKILKLQKDIDGYLRVFLYKNRKAKPHKVHRLVAYAFIPNDNIFKTEINHLNEDKIDNRVENLEWCTRKENANYGTRTERSTKANMNHPKKSKQVNQYSLDGNFIRSFPSTKEIERQLGFFQESISACCLGKIKTSHGFLWKYA